MDEKDKIIKEQRAKIKELQKELAEEWTDYGDEPEEGGAFLVLWEYGRPIGKFHGPFYGILEYLEGEWVFNDAMRKAHESGYAPKVTYWRELLPPTELDFALSEALL